jgi:hypothetical protein
MTETVAMQLLARGARADAAREALASALAGARVGQPDDTGIFEVELESDDREAALGAVWNAVAAAGADDEIAFAEHPSLPEHWRHLARAPRA